MILYGSVFNIVWDVSTPSTVLDKFQIMPPMSCFHAFLTWRMHRHGACRRCRVSDLIKPCQGGACGLLQESVQPRRGLASSPSAWKTRPHLRQSQSFEQPGCSVRVVLSEPTQSHYTSFFAFWPSRLARPRADRDTKSMIGATETVAHHTSDGDTRIFSPFTRTVFFLTSLFNGLRMS